MKSDKFKKHNNEATRKCSKLATKVQEKCVKLVKIRKLKLETREQC